MSFVKTISTKSEYDVLMATPSLVVVDFTATWCGPCKVIKPFFAELSVKYRNVAFASVDVDQHKEIAQSAGISAMPTFQFYVSGKKVTEIKGVNKAGLEGLVKQYGGLEKVSSSGEASLAPPGFTDLTEMITLNQLDCLNTKAGTSLRNVFKNDKSSLESDVDEQLILAIPFNQMVRLHSIQIIGPQNGPKTIKTYINHPTTLSFDEAENTAETEIISLSPEQLGKNSIVNLRFVKYQSVSSINIFVVDNQADSDSTAIERIVFYGTLVETPKGELQKVEHDH